MKLSVKEQHKLDLLMKELRVKQDSLKDDAYMLNPDTRMFLSLQNEIIILLYEQAN
jgi:hypothetical protein